MLGALNQELFQLQMADKETISDWGICLLRQLQVLAALFPECFPPNHVAELKCNHFYGMLPKCLKAMVAYLKANPQGKDLFQLTAGCKGSREGRLQGAILEPTKPSY